MFLVQLFNCMYSNSITLNNLIILCIECEHLEFIVEEKKIGPILITNYFRQPIIVSGNLLKSRKHSI